MPIFHLTCKVYSRKQGDSAVDRAAYGARACYFDRRAGIERDYTDQGGLYRTQLVLPADAPDWARDPQALWNAVEAAEVRRNAAVLREIEGALPADVPR